MASSKIKRSRRTERTSKSRILPFRFDALGKARERASYGACEPSEHTELSRYRDVQPAAPWLPSDLVLCPFDRPEMMIYEYLGGSRIDYMINRTYADLVILLYVPCDAHTSDTYNISFIFNKIFSLLLQRMTRRRWIPQLCDSGRRSLITCSGEFWVL